MINNDFVRCEPDIEETAVFNAKIEGEPTVQAVVNILKDKRATVRFFLPHYPSEQNFSWLKEKHPDEAAKVTKRLNEFIKERGAIVTYYGF